MAVGGSAGSVEALRTMCAALPSSLGAAMLVVVHHGATARSELRSVLQAVTPLQVLVAADGERPLPGRIYVGSPDHHLVLKDGVMRLTTGPRECHVRPAINVLFRSVAIAMGPRAAGVVLSGVLDDGTAGLWAIKDHGGKAYVQDPREARHPGMPASAIEHVAVDGVHPAGMLAGVLADWASSSAHAIAVQKSAHEALHRMETEIAIGSNPGPASLFALAQPSRFTCPECHGAMAEIREGPIVRLRCPIGHAYSVRVLLERLGAAAEEDLWRAMRTLEEKQMLLDWARARLPQEAGTANTAALAQAVDDLRVLAQSQARGAAPRMPVHGMLDP